MDMCEADVNRSWMSTLQHGEDAVCISRNTEGSGKVISGAQRDQSNEWLSTIVRHDAVDNLMHCTVSAGRKDYVELLTRSLQRQLLSVTRIPGFPHDRVESVSKRPEDPGIE
jgi:antibiotic biosynthesis monooxygenase (ABM) superfamily enzyme